jgi:hypothetical protein
VQSTKIFVEKSHDFRAKGAAHRNIFVNLFSFFACTDLQFIAQLRENILSDSSLDFSNASE